MISRIWLILLPTIHTTQDARQPLASFNRKLNSSFSRKNIIIGLQARAIPRKSTKSICKRTPMRTLPCATEAITYLLTRGNHKFIKASMANKRPIRRTCRCKQLAQRRTRPQPIRRMLGKRLNLLALIIANIKITMIRQSLSIRTWPLSPIEAFRMLETSSNSINLSSTLTIR